MKRLAKRVAVRLLRRVPGWLYDLSWAIRDFSDRVRGWFAASNRVLTRWDQEGRGER